MALTNLASPVNYNITPVDFSPLAQAGIQYAEGQRRQEQQAQRQEVVTKAQELFRAGDMDAVGEFAIANPELGKTMFEMGGIRDEAAQQRMTGLSKILTMSQAPVRDLKASIDQGEAIGRDMTHSKNMLDKSGGNPEMLKKIAEMGWAASDPKGYKSYRSSIDKEAGPTKTATGKDFAQYQELKKTDPEAAKQFGMSAGFINDKPKRLFQISKNDDGTTTKYFSDGTEQVVSASEKVKTPDMKSATSQEQAIKIIDKAKEGQLKNAGFALTLADGLENVNSMIDKGYDPMGAAWINKYLAGTTLGNIAMSPEDQTFVGSTEQMINAIARRETGAAITDFEKKDFFNRYMPTAGDSDARVKQKRDALERQFKSIRGQSGSVYDAIRVTQGLDDKQEAGAAQEDAQQQQQYSDGTVIRNPTTGATMIMRNGDWVNG